MAAAHRAFPRLLDHGDIVLGYVVLANEAIFRDGHAVCAGFCLHPRDPSLAFEVDELERVAQAILGARNIEPTDPDQAGIVSILRDGRERCFSTPVPPAWSRGRPLFLSSMLLYRDSFPGARLAASFLPVLVGADSNEVMPLPACYWAPDLAEAWYDIGAL